eukprot:GHVR01115243.1.p1 GENE.GHVR01115243.1~~GHVR01115243.1.p1  ORF type:complete len:168 (+),score=46.67 GHVR01115243.1:32-535(+)
MSSYVQIPPEDDYTATAQPVGGATVAVVASMACTTTAQPVAPSMACTTTASMACTCGAHQQFNREWNNFENKIKDSEIWAKEYEFQEIELNASIAQIDATSVDFDRRDRELDMSEMSLIDLESELASLTEQINIFKNKKNMYLKNITEREKKKEKKKKRINKIKRNK